MGNYLEGQSPLVLSGAKAGAGLTAASVQFTWVKLSADLTVVPCTAVTDIPIGVIQYPVKATGDEATVVVIGMTPVQQGAATLLAGYLIGTDGSGTALRVVPGTDTTHYIAGQVVNVGGVTTQYGLVTAVVNCATPTRGA